MKVVYQRLLEKALPYYKNSRKGDVEHIKWLVRTVPKFINENDVDFDILMPMIILHDIGYSKVPRDSNPFDLDIRKMHSEQGAAIAERLLKEVHYPENKIIEIKRLIMKHDNWALGDSFVGEPILRIFNNFDFMWMASKKGFDIVRAFLDKSPEEFCRQIEIFQEKNEKEGRVWFNKKIEDYYHKLLKEREKF